MIELSDLLTENRITDLTNTTKEEAIRELVEVISSAEQIVDKDRFLHALLERERILSTGVGLGVAVPHAKMDAVTDFVIAVGRSQQGIEFDALDAKPVHIVVMIGASEEQKDNYITVLAKVMSILKKDQARKQVMEAKTSEEILKVFTK